MVLLFVKGKFSPQVFVTPAPEKFTDGSTSPSRRALFWDWPAFSRNRVLLA